MDNRDVVHGLSTRSEGNSRFVHTQTVHRIKLSATQGGLGGCFFTIAKNQDEWMLWRGTRQRLIWSHKGEGGIS